jgi:hypothetical protein
MVLYYFGYLAIGKLLIWLIQMFLPLHWFIASQKNIYFREYLEKLFGCDLCLGVWVYFVLALIFNLNIFFLDYNIVVKIITMFLTSIISAFIMHLITLGWNDKFRIMEIK